MTICHHLGARKELLADIATECLRHDAEPADTGDAGAIADATSLHVATYVEILGWHQSTPSTTLGLAAIRMMFDWPTTGGVLPFNRPLPWAAKAFGQGR